MSPSSGRGYKPLAQPLPELVEVEPEDVGWGLRLRVIDVVELHTLRPAHALPHGSKLADVSSR